MTGSHMCPPGSKLVGSCRAATADLSISPRGRVPCCTHGASSLAVAHHLEHDQPGQDDREQRQALRFAMQHQGGDQGEVGVDEGGDQPPDGADAEVGPDPPAANGDDDGDGDEFESANWILCLD